MGSERRNIELSAAEIADLVDSTYTVMVATAGAGGWPHLVPMWFVRDGTDILAWTYRKSQKVRNVRRLPHATLLFEAGTAYDQLRGMSLECVVKIVEDPDTVRQVGTALSLKYQQQVIAQYGMEALESLVAHQSARRCVMRFSPVRTASWDHAKMSRPTAADGQSPSAAG